MIHFEWPLTFLLLPLPSLMRYALPIASNQQAALRVPFFEDFAGATGSRSSAAVASLTMFVIAVLAWLLLVTASARPQWLGEPIELPVSGRNLMLAIDLSGSMEVEDFRLGGRTVDRLSATKAVATEFIDRRVGDRVGLVLFGRQAYLQTPLTFDRETVKTLLLESAIGLAGKETAIGDAIGIAIKRLRGLDDDQRVLVLLTDGANTAGEVSPLKAAELAADEGMTIYTIGIGADEMEVRSLFGTQRVNPSADLDEDTLKRIAQLTGGRYFRAHDTSELEQIYIELDKLEPVEQEAQTFRPVQALYPWPLATALILAGLLVGVRVTRVAPV